MNERIRLLAKEAGLWRQHYDIGEESPERLEKFGELIVRECVDICNRVYFENYPDAEDFERSEEESSRTGDSK